MGEEGSTRAEPTERARKKAEKKAKILEAALKVFSRQGYVPASLDEVAKAADVAKGTLYLYFRDKENLFESTIMFVIDRLAERIRSNVQESMDPLRIFELLAYHQLDFFAGNRDFFAVFHNILHDNVLKKHKKLFDSLNKRMDELLEFVSSVVERGKKAGRIRRDVPTEDLVHIFGGMIMNMTRFLFHPAGRDEGFDAAEKARSITRVFLEGVVPAKNGTARRKGAY
jgi:TetR/AcrR family fatty acid metabolism transcriptional regulator